MLFETDEEEEVGLTPFQTESRRRGNCGGKTETEWTSEGERKAVKTASMRDGVRLSVNKSPRMTVR